MVKASGVVISMFALLLTGNDGNDDKDDYDDGNDDKGRGEGWGAHSLDQGGQRGARWTMNQLTSKTTPKSGFTKTP